MSFLDDPEMKEVVAEFCQESFDLLDRLENILEDIEETNDTGKLEEFGQVIDRIMGAAKSIGADDVGKYCELGKIIGYKAGQSKDEKLLGIVTATLFDTTDLLQKMLQKIETGNTNYMENISSEAFVKRLHWLSGKFQHIDRASVAFDEKAADPNEEIATLLKDLGL